MRNLSALIQRFSRVLDRKTLAKEVVAEAVRKHTGGTISPEHLSIEGTVLEVRSTPALNNEIKLKEKAVLDELRETHSLHIARVLYK